MATDLTFFFFLNEKKHTDAFKQDILQLNFKQNLFEFTFRGKEIKDSIYSINQNYEIIFDFFDIKIVSKDSMINLTIDYSETESDFFYGSLINPDSYELIINYEEEIFMTFKKHIDYIECAGHDRCLTSGIEEIYGVYQKGIDLKDYSLFVI